MGCTERGILAKKGKGGKRLGVEIRSRMLLPSSWREGSPELGLRGLKMAKIAAVNMDLCKKELCG